MSRAFVKETDKTFETLPDRSISPHQNLVTPAGFKLIEETVARLRHEHAVAHSANDRATQARIARDLRYWTPPDTQPPKWFRPRRMPPWSASAAR